MENYKMAFDWKKALGKVAPAIAGAIGSPLAGVATSTLLSVFGIDGDSPDAMDKLATRVQYATTEDLLLIKQADQNFILKMKELDIDLDKAVISDVQSARAMATALAQSLGKKNWRPDVMFLLAVLVTCGLVWVVWQDSTINEYVKGIFTLVLGRFLGYLDNIYNFEFGSTRSSKTKDETINSLSK